MKYKEGVEYQCVHSASKWYKVGEHYICQQDPLGTYFVGADGLKDYTSVMLSKFKEIKEFKEV